MDQRILTVFSPGFRIQSKILTDLRILQLQRFPVFIEFWARSLDCACDKVRIVDLSDGQKCLVLFVFVFVCVCVAIAFFCMDKTQNFFNKQLVRSTTSNCSCYSFVYFSDRFRLMSTDQTYSGSLTRLREKELILYVTFTVQITFPFGCERHNTHNSPCKIRLKSCARKCAMSNFDIARFLAQGLGFLKTCS